MAQKVIFNLLISWALEFTSYAKGRKKRKQNAFSDATETTIVQNLTVVLVDAPGSFDHFVVGLNTADMKRLGLSSGDYIKLLAKKGKHIVAIVDGDSSTAEGFVRIPSSARINLRFENVQICLLCNLVIIVIKSP